MILKVSACRDSNGICDLLTQVYNCQSFTTPSWLALYEIERHGWDANSAFKKIGSGFDKQGYYKILFDNEVEFYCADSSLLEVSAFEGWDLSQSDFEPDVQEFFDWGSMGLVSGLDEYD